MQRPDDPDREEALSPDQARRRPARSGDDAGIRQGADPDFDAEEATLELHEERLSARKQMERAGEVSFHKEVQEVPGRLEVEAYQEDVDVEHVKVDEVVQEKVDPWKEGDTLIVPVYEERISVVKQLVMREQVRIRRVGTSSTRVVEDTLRQERLRIDDQHGAGRVRERHSTVEDPSAAKPAKDKGEPRGKGKRGFLDNVA